MLNFWKVKKMDSVSKLEVVLQLRPLGSSGCCSPPHACFLRPWCVCKYLRAIFQGEHRGAQSHTQMEGFG